MHTIFVVFGHPIMRSADPEFLGAYTTLEGAQRFIDAQKPSVRNLLSIDEVELNRCYGDPAFWKAPVRLARHHVP